MGHGQDVAVKGREAYTMQERLKLIQGAAGIYFFFIQYGRMQEKIFQFKSPAGKKFTQVWFLQLIDALCNVGVGFVGRQLQGSTSGLPQDALCLSGFAQVFGKWCLSASLAAGLSFPVATLAKSAKMIPVMLGSLIIGGQKFSTRQITQCTAIVGGTSLVTMAMGGKGGSNSAKGLMLVLAALGADGLVGGLQKQFKNRLKKDDKKVLPYDMMFWTNFYMAVGSLVMAAAFEELKTGLSFCRANPAVTSQILKFGVCGAMGQASIFYTIANFDSVVCTAVTTTRKLVSVLISLFEGGTQLTPGGWLGLSIASAGIVGEVI